jgi:hypothetical protein
MKATACEKMVKNRSPTNIACSAYARSTLCTRVVLKSCVYTATSQICRDVLESPGVPRRTARSGAIQVVGADHLARECIPGEDGVGTGAMVREQSAKLRVGRAGLRTAQQGEVLATVVCMLSKTRSDARALPFPGSCLGSGLVLDMACRVLLCTIIISS